MRNWEHAKGISRLTREGATRATRDAWQHASDSIELATPGESLSSFVHDSVTRTIEFRRAEREFVERGLASAAKARRTGRYLSSDAALKTLRRQLEQGRPQARKS